MNNNSASADFFRRISIWKVLRIVAVLTIVWVVYSMSAEAYSLTQVFVWLKDRMLELTWEAPKSECDHYRLEISKTDLLAEPVTTTLSYTLLRLCE